MVGYFNYTVWLTYLSLVIGGCGIYISMSGNPLGAIICLGICGFLDLFDGKVARTKKDRTSDEKQFGIQIDSLTDLVCFGVLPVVIGYAVGMTEVYFVVIFALFILAGMIRLAYFNVYEMNRDPKTDSFFYGVPITSSAIIFPFIYLSRVLLKENFYILYAVTLVVTMLAFVIKIKIKKPSAKVFVPIAVAFGLAFIVLLILEIVFYGSC